MTKKRPAASLHILALVAALVLGQAAHADDDDRPTQTQKPQLRSASVNFREATGLDEVDGPTILEGIPALNGLDAMRDKLRDRYGFYFHGVYLSDPYANLAGGMKQGATYSGRLDVELDVDAEKVAGIKGGTLHANMFQIHGRDLSGNYIGNFLSINDIAALPTTRLYELWYEQKLGDMLSVRVGQQGSDVELLTSNYAANFINATFGWPGLTSENLPDGGPAYPLAAPAVRLKFTPTKDLSILAVVFDDRPAGPCPTDPQVCDRYGVNFRVSDRPLAFLEAQYRYNRGDSASGLPGTLKVGAFGDFRSFDDQRFGTNGLPLAVRGSTGIAVSHAPNGGAYGIIDQQIYRLPGGDDDDAGKGDDDDKVKGIGLFTRVMGAPPDRNPVEFYVDGGVAALGMIPGRPNDLVGLAGAFAKISTVAAAADADLNAATGIAAPVRSFEAVIELTYQAQIVPGLTIQPTFEYIVHPGGNIADPYGNGRTAIRNAAVFGATTAIRF